MISGGSPRRPISPEQQAKDNAGRQRLHDQMNALLNREKSGDQLPTSPVLPVETPPNPIEALKVLGLYRKSPRHQPVLSGYTPSKVVRPVVFPHQVGQDLTRLSRRVSRAWVQLLTSVSSTSLAGGKLSSSQGRNLITIVETLRQHCYLQVDEAGRPIRVREQVIQVVDGDAFCFAKECGMSHATFYRALRHPLAHLFVRTQKVQVIEEGTQARRNVGTLFSVSLYEPPIPPAVDELFWSEPVELLGELVVLDSTYQSEPCKGRPCTTQVQKETCGKVQKGFGSSSSGANEAHRKLLRWLDMAAMGTRSNSRASLDPVQANLESCIDKIRNVNPDLWEFAVQIALHHDSYENAPVAAVGYYKALIHLDVGVVRQTIQRIEKWKLQGQFISNPGRLLTSLLSKECKRKTGFPLRDLGSQDGLIM